ASGVKVDSVCKQAYDDLHNKHLHSYLIFRISDDDTTIIVEKKGEKNAPYAEFVKEMKSLVGDGKQCRYAAVDVQVDVQRQGAEGMSRISKVRALKATLGLESLLQIQASELSDIDEKVIKHEVMSSQRA
uniref:ADF-H domain-containing protein n=1 Tax=Meloidogyne hapla TaxID=6305 RepID=A0A1I8B691_MELHA